MTAKISLSQFSLQLVAFLFSSLTVESVGSNSTRTSLCTINVQVPSCHVAGLDLSQVLPVSVDWWTWDVIESSNSTEILLNCSSTTTKVNLDNCTCKPNYGGEKCDICADGYHTKYTWGFHSKRPSTRSPSHSPTDLGRPENLSGLTKRQSRIFDCKSCGCYPLGSKSHVCDKKKGSCSCLDGYLGDKCDKCSFGYYNDSLKENNTPRDNSNKLSHGSSHERGRCLRCDECFDQWYLTIRGLKDLSVDIIRRTRNIERPHAFNSELSAPSEEYESSKSKGMLRRSDYVNHHGDQFSDLNEKLSRISEYALNNKRNSDRLLLFYDAIESVSEKSTTMKNSLHELQDIKRILLSDLGKLNLKSTIANDLIEGLYRLSDKVYLSEQVEAQQNSPEGALKLMIDYSNKSQHQMDDSLKYYHQYRDNIGELQKELADKLHWVRNEQSWFKVALTNLIEESIVTAQISNSSDFLALVGSYFRDPEEQSDLFRWGQKAEVAQQLTRQMGEQLNQQLHESGRRGTDLSSIMLWIEEANSLMNQTEPKLGGLLKGLRECSESINQLNDFTGSGSSSNNSNHSNDIIHLFRGGSEMMRRSLDRSIAKRNSAQLYLSNLVKSRHSNDDVIRKILKFYDDIIKTTESKTNETEKFIRDHKIEIEEFFKLDSESEMILAALNRTSNDLISVVELEQSVNLTMAKTKVIDSKTKEAISDLELNLDENIESTRLMSNQSQCNLVNELVGKSTSCWEINLTDELKLLQKNQARLEVELAVSRADLRRQIGASKVRMNSVNTKNELLLMDLKLHHHDLLEYTSSMSEMKLSKLSQTPNETGQVVANTTIMDRSKRLSQSGRTIGLIEGYRELSRLLLKLLSKTESLGDDFALNEHTFVRQQGTLDLLHNEMDKLILDIQSGDLDCS